ncbi:hypothetical protein M9Y10_026580 [Tritrichomonas musculus]|uniref:Adenylate and Guanylate cyclase catalytic domain containing protein n=1 Tax=Tritrichomonas musculus TaxID=1915356 RepID=A0ABR2H8C7_9EUKA
MKNSVEPSVISRSQSESKTEPGKSQLVHGTTTKLDALFQIFDQVCTKSHIPTFIYATAAAYVYFQIIFSSLYPFNKYWYEVNEGRTQYPANAKIITVFHYLEAIAWYFRIQDPKLDSIVGDTKGESNLTIPALLVLAAFVFSIISVSSEILGAFRLNKLKIFSFYTLRIGFAVASHAMNIPIGAFFGAAVRNIVLSGGKLNWFYMFVSFLMYFVSMSYIYLGFMLMNQSTTISKGPFSSFSLKIPFFLLITCSSTVIFQCIFSLFNTWAMIIVQLAHIAIGAVSMKNVIYLVFHSKFANIVFIGVLLSTWINDLIFFILHFVKPPPNDGLVHSGVHFFYIAGLVLPLVSLFASMTISYFFVNYRYNSVLKQVKQLSDEVDSLDANPQESSQNNMTNNQETALFYDHKLFRDENSALMAIHISFTNCLPLFYKFSAINYTVNHFPTVEVMMQAVHYMCFFPGAARKMNSILSHVSQFRSLNYHQRFLLFQIYRIKMLRQSSISPDSNRRLNELKSASNQAYEDVYSFWGSKTANVFYLEMLSNVGWKIDNKWEDAIRDFPNFQKFSDEYCTFLIECQMDLERALLMKQRTNMIELGRNFIVDVPFINLARHYPLYLKNGIVDYQGSFKTKKAETAAGSANGTVHSGNSGSHEYQGSLSSSASSLFSNYNLDPEIKETLGRQLFKQAVLRLEMHRSLKHRKSYTSKLLLFIALLILFGGLALYLGVYFYIDDYVVRRSNSMYYLNLASKARFYLDLSVLGITLKFAYFSNRFTSLDFFNNLDRKDNYLTYKNKSGTTSYNSDMFRIDDQISDTLIHRNNRISYNSFNQLILDLSLLGQNKNENIYAFAKIMMNNEVSFYSCYDGIPGGERKLSLKTMESYMHFVVEQVAAKKVEEGLWYNSNEICEIMSNQPILELSTLQLFQTLMQHEVSLCEAEDRFINVFSFAFPVVPLTIFLIPTFVFIRLFFKDANKLVNLLLNVSQDAKDEARKPIRKDSTVELVQPSERKPRSKLWLILQVLDAILFIATAVIIYLMFSEIKELNGNVKKLGRWNLLASIRMASSVEVMNYILHAVILNGSSSFNLSSSDRVVSTRAKMLYLTRSGLVQLNNANEELLKGNELVGPSSGFDEELDSINTETLCDVTIENTTDMHDSYRCSSASQGVGLFITMVEEIMNEIDSTGGNFNNSFITHTLHLLNRHLLERLEQAVDRIHDINIIMCKEFEKKTLIYFICGMIVIVFIFVINMIFYIKSVVIYSAGMFLVQRLPPSTFFSNKKLQNFVMSKKELKTKSEMSTSQSVLFMSHDPIICTNSAGAIEIVNPAVTETLGFTPDQMLGQHISTFFVDLTEDQHNEKQQEKENSKENENIATSDAERISNQLELMKNGQCGMVYEDHYICLTDDEREMPAGVTILGMSSHGQINANEDDHHSSSINVDSFVFIIRDETELVQQQREAERAKAQSENLLYHILPRDIVVRLNRGEKDISFTVQSASIIFTDIVKFSEYASGLSPQEIMGSLSKVFAAFDACAKKYDLITKIKLIGDIYMAAAGLFSDETVEPKMHAIQILRFGMDCLKELDDVNIKLNANLQLRVGINSGGPLLAGVLGTDKPVFDIIGDPINVAARLQTTDVPGKAQIPKSTFDLICDEDFQVEERGEVFLKGKGKTMAYLVSPVSNTNVLLDASSSIPILEDQTNK